MTARLRAWAIDWSTAVTKIPLPPTKDIRAASCGSGTMLATSSRSRPGGGLSRLPGTYRQIGIPVPIMRCRPCFPTEHRPATSAEVTAHRQLDGSSGEDARSGPRLDLAILSNLDPAIGRRPKDVLAAVNAQAETEYTLSRRFCQRA